MLRLARPGQKAKQGEKPVAIGVGGPYDQHVIMARDACSSESAEDDTTFPGLIAPRGTSWMPLPDLADGQRTVGYVVGASGSGKSTYARDFAEVFRDATGSDRIFVACPDDIQSDPAFRDSGFVWISPDDVADGPPSFAELTGDGAEDCLIIFDDVESAGSKKKNSVFKDFADQILERGRKKRCHCLYLAHRPAAGVQSRVPLLEATHAWFNPASGGSSNFDYWFKNHLHLNPELRRLLKKGAPELGRFVWMATNSTPRVVVSPKRVFLLDDDEADDAVAEFKAQKRADIKASISGAPKDARKVSTGSRTYAAFKQEHAPPQRDDEADESGDE